MLKHEGLVSRKQQESTSILTAWETWRWSCWCHVAAAAAAGKKQCIRPATMTSAATDCYVPLSYRPRITIHHISMSCLTHLTLQPCIC